jgi:cell division protein ZapA (FtsZ GTPase activity inhibitor)
MYKELGGYLGYMATPVRELQEVRLSIIAELNIQAEIHKEQDEKQAEMEREAERQRGRR